MQTRGENKDFSRDTILRVSPSRGAFIVEEHKPGGVVSYKEIEPMDVYFAINGSYDSKELLTSGFLPEHCLSVAMSGMERHLVIWNPELRADMFYRDKEYLDFPLPRLVFGVRLLAGNRMAECSIGVVADEPPTPETKMYRYPFSNVYGNGKVCTGNNVLPCYKRLSSLKHFPRYLLGIPDNDDFFTAENNRLQMEHGELMEHLKDKDPSYYYTDVLVESGMTLNTGERKDAFKFTYDGRRYDRLSLSEKVRAGMEVSELIKRLTGRNYPVFVDNMESIDDLANVRPTGQVIMAKCVSGAQLQVRPAGPISGPVQRAA